MSVIVSMLLQSLEEEVTLTDVSNSQASANLIPLFSHTLLSPLKSPPL